MNSLILIIASGLALLLMIAASFYAAYKTVNKESAICQERKRSENEVSLDEITGKYLKLTNLD